MSDPAGPGAATSGQLSIRLLTPELMDSLAVVLRGGWGASCWCMYPRLTRAQMQALPGVGSERDRRRAAMLGLAERAIAPGLLAFEDGEPVGWIAVAPRPEFARIDASRATPPVDDVAVWVISCITVRKSARRRGIAVFLIREAVTFARSHGAPAVEAYPRAGSSRTSDENAYFGTEPLFARAGFTVVRGPLTDIPKNWIARVTMRAR